PFAHRPTSVRTAVTYRVERPVDVVDTYRELGDINNDLPTRGDIGGLADNVLLHRSIHSRAVAAISDRRSSALHSETRTDEAGFLFCRPSPYRRQIPRSSALPRMPNAYFSLHPRTQGSQHSAPQLHMATLHSQNLPPAPSNRPPTSISENRS